MVTFAAKMVSEQGNNEGFTFAFLDVESVWFEMPSSVILATMRGLTLRLTRAINFLSLLVHVRLGRLVAKVSDVIKFDWM